MRTRGQDRRDLRGTAAFAAGLLALLLAGCEEKKQAAPPPPPPEVVLAEAAQETVPIVVQASGTIKAVKNVEIIPRVTGYIFERYFKEGTFVDEGAPLYLIDPRPFEDKLARLEAQLEGEKATLEFWTSEDQRYSKLAKTGAASQEEAEGARAKMRATTAEIAATEVEIRNAKLNLSYTRINAPFYGRTQQTRINVGNLVQKERDVLTSLVMMDPIYVVFQLSRSQVFKIQQLIRDDAAFAVKDMVVEVLLSDGRIYEKKGTVNFVSTEIDPTTDSMTVRGIFENAKRPKFDDFDLIPGQYVPVRFTVGNTPDALVIPQTAVVETQAGTHVYVVGADNKAEHRPITLGRPHGTKIIVTAGLKPGEKVVVEGVQKVRAGNAVKPVAPKEPAEDAPTAEAGPKEGGAEAAQSEASSVSQ